MAEKNSAQTNKQTDRHYENNGHLAVNQQHIPKSPNKVPLKTLTGFTPVNSQKSNNYVTTRNRVQCLRVAA